MESPSKHFYFMTSVDVSDSESALNEDQNGESGKTRSEGGDMKFRGKSLFNDTDFYDRQVSPVDDVTFVGEGETSDLFSDTESTIAWENTNLEFLGSVAEFPRSLNNSKQKECHMHSESVLVECGNDNKQIGGESGGGVNYNGQDLEQDENRISKSGVSRSVVSGLNGVCNSTPISCFSVSKQNRRGTGRRNDCPEKRPIKCSNRSNCRASKKLGRNSLRTQKDGTMKDEIPMKCCGVDPVCLEGSRPDFVVIDIPRYSDFYDSRGPVPKHPQMVVHHQRGRERTSLVESSRDVYIDFDKYAVIQQKIPHRRIDLFSDGESSGNSTESSTVATNENQTSNLDQIWDEYQDPLYPTVSDSTGEEKLDATGLVGDWQDHVIDDDVFVYQCDAKRRTNSVKHNVPEDPLESSDTDVGEMAEFMGESRVALRVTRKSIDQLERQAADKNDVKYNEPRATCRTSINCIETLLDALIHRSPNHSRSSDLHRSSESVESDDVRKLSKLLKRWKTLLRRLDRGSNRNSHTKDGARNDGARIQDSVTGTEETQLFPTVSSESNELCRRGTSNIPDELIRTNSKENHLEPHPVENVKSAKRPEESIGLPIRLLIIVVALFSIYFILVRYFVYEIPTFQIIPHLNYIKGPPPF